jgi:hypothetical protein
MGAGAQVVVRVDRGAFGMREYPPGLDLETHRMVRCKIWSTRFDLLASVARAILAVAFVVSFIHFSIKYW